MTTPVDTPSPATPSGLLAVELIGLPTLIRAQAMEHHEELMRELQLLSLRGETAGIPRPLLALAERVHTQYAGFAAAATAQIDAAARAGSATADVLFAVPRTAGAAAAALLALLEEADAYCHAEQLLTLSAPPSVLAYRRWFLGEFVSQTAGARPTPWLAYLARRTPGGGPSYPLASHHAHFPQGRCVPAE